MATEKNVKARVVFKHDTANHWAEATGFIPNKGEIILYDPYGEYNYTRIKIGDGVNCPNNLPFFLENIYELNEALKVAETNVFLTGGESSEDITYTDLMNTVFGERG